MNNKMSFTTIFHVHHDRSFDATIGGKIAGKTNNSTHGEHNKDQFNTIRARPFINEIYLAAMPIPLI